MFQTLWNDSVGPKKSGEVSPNMFEPTGPPRPPMPPSSSLAANSMVTQKDKRLLADEAQQDGITVSRQ